MPVDGRRRTDAMFMEAPFLGGAYEGRSKSLNAQQSVNLFPVFDQNDAKKVIAMYGTPGYTAFSSPATEAIVRGLHVMGSYLYAVVGAVVYEIAANGTATSLGSITTSTGHVGMSDNGTQLLISDGTIYGHIVTTGTLTDIPIADNDYPAGTDNAFFDGYFIATVAGTGKFQISTLYNGHEWDALDFATAESAPDNLVAVGTTRKNILFFGEISTEFYYNSGNADFPLERVPGAVIDTGCAARSSVVEIEGDVYWLTHKGQIARSKGYDREIISTPSIDYQISTYTTKSDALAYTYTLEGRTFYVINFPTHNKTWVVDITSGQWHEWRYTTATQHKGVSGVSRGVQFNGKTLIGDRANGKIYALGMNTYTDDGTAITRVRRSQILYMSRVNVLHRRAEIEFEPGVGLNVEAGVGGYDPQATLKWSDDGGNTWSAGRAVSIGGYQSYDTRAIWRQLGKSRNRVYELTVAEPVKVVLIGAYFNLEACRF